MTTAENVSEGAQKLSPWLWYACVLVGCSTCSLGGFFYGALHDPVSDGGRGGAIASALAFASLFVRSDYSQRSFRFYAVEVPKLLERFQAAREELIGQTVTASPESNALQEERQTVNGILAILNAQARDQRNQNICVAAAGAVSTLSWGFGDKAACFLCNHWYHFTCRC
jgi:hypothetical protein